MISVICSRGALSAARSSPYTASMYCIAISPPWSGARLPDAYHDDVRARRISTARLASLGDRSFCREARQPIGDVEPCSLEADEDVTLWPKSGIVVECPCRDADHAPVHRRDRPTAYLAECPSIPWRFYAYWCLV